MLFSRCYILPTIQRRYTVRVLLNMLTWRRDNDWFSSSCFMFTTSCLLSSILRCYPNCLITLESRINDLPSFITFLPYRYNGRRSCTPTTLYALKSHTTQSFLDHLPPTTSIFPLLLTPMLKSFLLRASLLHIHTYPHALTHTHGVSVIIVPPLSCPR